jgi:hypothetical protein
MNLRDFGGDAAFSIDGALEIKLLAMEGGRGL